LHLQNSILGIALIIIAGYAGAKALRKIHFPAVTAYLLIGILIGPRLLNLIPVQVINASDFISNFVLGIIAFMLGAHFTLKDLKAAGKPVIWISVLEAGFAWVIVTVIMILYLLVNHLPIHPAFVLGAAASATAPAATVMIIREYRAHGPVTNMLLRVVALDDAWCLIFSALAITIASAISIGVFTAGVIMKAFLDIIAAVILGGILGLAFHFITRFVTTKDELLTVTVGFIFLSVGLSITLHISPLLTNMVLGLIIANVSKESTLFFETLSRVDPVLFLSFFVLVGANLEISMIPRIGVLGLLYIVFRVIGKFIGVKLGSMLSHAEKNISKYLAWGLVPQAGVALGVALIAKELYPKYGELIFTTITATTVIYELIGPLCAKYGLKKAREI
jgi:Kef-type K+ transport system membrane component KefB